MQSHSLASIPRTLNYKGKNYNASQCLFQQYLQKLGHGSSLNPIHKQAWIKRMWNTVH